MGGKFTLGVLTFLLVSIFAAAIPGTYAASDTWAVQEHGTLTNPALTNSQFSGTCTFLGATGGTGSCSITLHFNSATYSFKCILTVTVANWTSASMQAGGANGFWLNSGTVIGKAPTQAEASQCALYSTPSGALDSSGNIISPIDTMVPVAKGTFQFYTFGQLQADATVQVTLKAS